MREENCDRRVHRRHTYWKRLGVPGPPAHLIFGNESAIFKGFHVIDEEWTRDYGETYGFGLLFSGLNVVFIVQELYFQEGRFVLLKPGYSSPSTCQEVSLLHGSIGKDSTWPQKWKLASIWLWDRKRRGRQPSRTHTSQYAGSEVEVRACAGHPGLHIREDQTSKQGRPNSKAVDGANL